MAERGGIEHQYVKSLSGWSPKYIPESLLREAATRLQDRFLFGSDYPFITPQRWLKDFEAVKIEFKPEVREKLLWRNGQKLLANTVVGHMHFSSEGDVLWDPGMVYSPTSDPAFFAWLF